MLRTAIYIDGFNLYYGCLKGTASRWLDLRALCDRVLAAHNEIVSIKYFTALVGPEGANAGAVARQKLYLKALEAHIPELEIVLGHFLSHSTLMPPTDPSLGRLVEVRKTEEKGSDVNLAVHMLNDAWRDVYDCGVVISNDSDLTESLRLIRREHPGKVLGVVYPISRPGRRASRSLREATDFQKQVWKSALRTCQLPDPVIASGKPLHRPPSWS